MKKKKSIFEINISFSKITALQKSFFAKNLALMLKAGLDIVESLEIIKSQATGNFKSVISDILTSIRSGNSLSNSFKKHPKVFSPLFVNTIIAGESSGTLAENLDNLADHLKKNYELVSKIKGALVYPIIIIIGALGLGTVLAFAVLPKIIPMFENLKVELPFTTRMLIMFSHFVENYRTPLLVLITGGTLFFAWFIKRDFSKPITHYILLKIPIIKTIIKNSNLASYCNSLGMLLKSGLIIDEALAISKEVVGNYYYKKSLIDVHRRTIQGNKLSDNLALHGDLFPQMVVNMIKVGERSGNLENSLFHLANYCESEVDNSTKALSTAIEPVLLVVIGIFVGILAISIITPIYKITGNAYK